jgi:hypothetical protein
LSSASRVRVSQDAHSRRERRFGLVCRPGGLRLVEPELHPHRALLSNTEHEQVAEAGAGRILAEYSSYLVLVSPQFLVILIKVRIWLR